MKISNMFTEEVLAIMEGLDITSSTSSGGSSTSQSQQEDQPGRPLTLVVKQEGAHALTFETLLRYDPLDRFHYLHVGRSPGGEPCVTITVDNDNTAGGSCTLQGVRYKGSCCVGGGMQNGLLGTVPMIRGALKAAAQLPPFCDCSEVYLTDNSYKPATGTSCADFHMMSHASHKTWYEENFDGVVQPAWAARLRATREALQRPVSTTTTVGDFCRAALAAAVTQEVERWWCGSEQAIRAAFVACLRADPACTWARLLTSLLTQFDDKKCRMLRTMLTMLGRGEVCPGWTTCAGFGWSIPMASIRGWDNIRIEIGSSTQAL